MQVKKEEDGNDGTAGGCIIPIHLPEPWEEYRSSYTSTEECNLLYSARPAYREYNRLPKLADIRGPEGRRVSHNLKLTI